MKEQGGREERIEGEKERKRHIPRENENENGNE